MGTVRAGERQDGRVDIDEGIQDGSGRVRLRDHHPCVERQQPKAEQPSVDHRSDQHGAFAVRGTQGTMHLHGPGAWPRRTAGSY
jgi:hypothetical protein